jgi:hypothetical protein
MTAQGAVPFAEHNPIVNTSFSAGFDFAVTHLSRDLCRFSRGALSSSFNGSAFAPRVRSAVPPPTG